MQVNIQTDKTPTSISTITKLRKSRIKCHLKGRSIETHKSPNKFAVSSISPYIDKSFQLTQNEVIKDHLLQLKQQQFLSNYKPNKSGLKKSKNLIQFSYSKTTMDKFVLQPEKKDISTINLRHPKTKHKLHRFQSCTQESNQNLSNRVVNFSSVNTSLQTIGMVQQEQGNLQPKLSYDEQITQMQRVNGKLQQGQSFLQNSQNLTPTNELVIRAYDICINPFRSSLSRPNHGIKFEQFKESQPAIKKEH